MSVLRLDSDNTSTALLDAIRHAANNAPRSQQRAIGPSEVGQSCKRRVLYRLLDVDPAAAPGDPWRPTVGTACHAWLADALESANTELGYKRWITEKRVNITDDLAGSCDVYDALNAEVVDWKVVGPTNLKKYRSKGPSDQYRTQVHLYGLGYINAGLDVKTVSIMFLPSAGNLTDGHMWSEPWDINIADRAVQSLDLLRLVASMHPDAATALATVPPTPDMGCLYCPFHSPGSTDLAVGCPGVPSAPRTPATVDLTGAVL